MARRDYLNDPHAPRANSIAVACSAFIQDDSQRILVIRRTDNGKYSIPGGQVEPGETLSQAVQREVREETGISIEVVGLIGIYSNPNHVVEYDDGEIRQEFSICFRGEAVGGQLSTSSESSEVVWVSPKSLDDLDVHPSTRLRISHALRRSANPYFS